MNRPLNGLGKAKEARVKKLVKTCAVLACALGAPFVVFFSLVGWRYSRVADMNVADITFSWSQSVTEGDVAGTVSDSSDRPLSDFHLFLSMDSGTAHTVTDASGAFSVSLPSGIIHRVYFGVNSEAVIPVSAFYSMRALMFGCWNPRKANFARIKLK